LARAGVGVATVLLLLAVAGAFVAGQVDRWVDDLGELALASCGALNCALAARSASGRLRASWAALGAACLSWAIGEAIWSWYELALHTTTPFPSVADIGFLGFPLGALAALALFPAGANYADRLRMTLDGLSTACAIGLVSWGTALGAVVDAGGDSTLATAVSVAYPLSDIALLVMCVMVLSRSRAHRLPLAFVAGGLALMAVSDSGFAYLTAQGTYGTGNPVDLGWFLAFGLVALATLAPGATTARAQPDAVAVAGAVLPYVPVVVAAGFIGWRYSTGHRLGSLESLLIGILVLLVLLRQFLTARDNHRLARALAEREAQLRHQAFHDGLTGLANRALYVDRVAHALDLHRRDGRALAVCFLDLDGFKTVNDTQGHGAGDELLRQASERFRRVLSDADTLARLGGDEFAVLLEDHPDPLTVANDLLASLDTPFDVGGPRVSVLASIGVARVDPDDPTPTVDELLMRADIAMYAVKRGGKADVLLHSAGLQLEEIDDVALGRAFAQALVDQQVTLAFQPVVELSTGSIYALEALARWTRRGTDVPPEVFVRVAERCNLMDPLFRLVLAEACTQLAGWRALPGGSRLRVAVNVSPRQLASPGLPMIVNHELRAHGLTGDRLVLEITETEGMADTAVSRAVCDQLRALGVRLSVDDFGTGLSSLARLRDLPIDEVKIDRSFVANLDHDEGGRRFVRGVLAFAEEVGLAVVAEGVEREAERAALTDLGCHLAQGFLFSPPVPAEAVAALLMDAQAAGSRIPAQGESIPLHP
jgi:diguanylate cyclase (GGDEF)-like protein